MNTQIFNKVYDSESVSDIFRDVSEAFDSNYNPEFKVIEDSFDENSEVLVTFIYKNDMGDTQELLNKTYYQETIIDIEEDIQYSFKNLSVKQDEYGFFDGDLIVTFTLKCSED